ncbi:MAG TPA: hypothetical protein VMI75_23035 [Polyangiaceae bacterium]|nr:hypothetical protein [Polyangiaceae bacterium]
MVRTRARTVRRWLLACVIAAIVLLVTALGARLLYGLLLAASWPT